MQGGRGCGSQEGKGRQGKGVGVGGELYWRGRWVVAGVGGRRRGVMDQGRSYKLNRWNKLTESRGGGGGGSCWRLGMCQARGSPVHQPGTRSH
ncbi:hypothetical protein Pcinc_042976 [Petrolisthes cinctipes]|uniref:Uncharacterized protein n=1 Tax=Petrolisthes cinctipes TaxID=88211 RepID=A0AAE1BIG9_PETCI|nr:hypothetical protein Pcinc_042976 [Petrolisthes cinctipes]